MNLSLMSGMGKIFKDRAAIVTGSGSGNGKAIAKAIASLGGKVAVVDKYYEKALETVSEIQKFGETAMALQVDVSQKNKVVQMVNEVVDAFHTIDILVNNAGIITNKAFLEISEAEWDEVLNVNLRGAFFCSQCVAKIMASKRQGVILNISSIESEKYLPKSCHYAVSKAGLLMLTRAMAVDLAPYNIRVNSIGPGVILTGMTGELLKDIRQREKYMDMIPLGRIGTPEDIAGAVVFLASDFASYITGANIYIDGGLSCI